MKKSVQRILIFFLGIPAIALIVLFLPYYNHLVLNLLIVLFSSLGAAELSIILAQKNMHISKTEASILGALQPLMMTLAISFGFNPLLLPAVITASVSWLLVSQIFSRGNKIDSIITHIAAGCAVLLYPGMLLTWLVRLSRLENNPGLIIMIFICTVYCCDGMAWAAGMLFGKGNQGIIPISPNKSIAGFIGGILASIIVGTGSTIIWPHLFVLTPGSILGNPLVAGALLGMLTGIAAIIGDLGESAIKRSSGLKDSGSIIPGRGGVLDSIDSIALAAPVFYIAYTLLFTGS